MRRRAGEQPEQTTLLRDTPPALDDSSQLHNVFFAEPPSFTLHGSTKSGVSSQCVGARWMDEATRVPWTTSPAVPRFGSDFVYFAIPSAPARALPPHEHRDCLCHMLAS